MLVLYLSISYLGSANMNGTMFSIPLDHWWVYRKETDFLVSFNLVVINTLLVPGGSIFLVGIFVFSTLTVMLSTKYDRCISFSYPVYLYFFFLSYCIRLNFCSHDSENLTTS